MQVPGRSLAEVVSSDALWICGKDGSIQQQVMQTLFGLLEPHGVDLVNDTQVGLAGTYHPACNPTFHVLCLLRYILTETESSLSGAAQVF